MLGDNLRFIRKLKGLSQSDLSTALKIPRTTLGDYERSHTEPNIKTLKRIAKFFDLSLDQLLNTKLNKTNIDIGRTHDLKILAISVDKENHNHIDLVETKASAGYLDAYSDPEFIKDLPKISFPSIPSGTFRAFEIIGDSMLPMQEGSIVICSYIERLSDIKDDKTYVVVSKDNGLVYKRLTNLKNNNEIVLSSDNEVFKPYRLPYKEIAEIWQYYAHISFDDSLDSQEQKLNEKLKLIHSKVQDIHEQLIVNNS